MFGNSKNSRVFIKLGNDDAIHSGDIEVQCNSNIDFPGVEPAAKIMERSLTEDQIDVRVSFHEFHNAGRQFFADKLAAQEPQR